MAIASVKALSSNKRFMQIPYFFKKFTVYGATKSNEHCIVWWHWPAECRNTKQFVPDPLRLKKHLRIWFCQAWAMQTNINLSYCGTREVVQSWQIQKGPEIGTLIGWLYLDEMGGVDPH